MFKLKSSVLLFLLLLSVLLIAPYAYAAEQPTIRVGLWTNQPSILLRSEVDYSIKDVVTGKTIKDCTAQERVIIAVKPEGMTVNGSVVLSARLSISPKDKDEKQAIEVNKRHYRGTIEIFRTTAKQGITAINILPLEWYLYGTASKEIPVDWPLEAIKAQAVAARTYAIHNLGKHRAEGFDVCATTDCQVYGGKEEEAAAVLRAVDQTFGQVITYHGQTIDAFYHSSGGLYTEDSENVWGKYVPYLRGVEDYTENTSHYQWEKTITAKELELYLHKAGHAIGTLKAIGLSPLQTAPMSAEGRGTSGRVKTIQFIGSTGSVDLTGNQFRNMLGLASTLFDVKMQTPGPKDIVVDFSETGGLGSKTIALNVPPDSRKSFLCDKDNLRHLTGLPGEVLVFSGYGYGHGLGLSQWGAKVMAEKAMPGDTTYFIKILQHYYQGVQVKKMY
ncbi:MAG: SpoIID/LytB domain-containing protein [Pelosinus sp.]|nr:SpoIID/LytB domain-containing protein [Pelosinus sp.]